MAAKLAAFQDAFAGSALDATKWAAVVGSPTVGGQQLTMAVDETAPATLVESVDGWDLTASQLVFRLGLPALSATVSTVTQIVDRFGFNGAQIAVVGENPGALRFRLLRGGALDETAMDWDARHAYGRIREHAGQLYWDTSPDGQTFVNRRVAVHGVDLTEVFVRLGATLQSTAGYGHGPYGSGPFGGGP